MMVDVDPFGEITKQKGQKGRGRRHFGRKDGGAWRKCHVA
jgi:hypothetical protein